MYVIDFKKLPKPKNRITVTGGKGTSIVIQEWGNPKGLPIVFAHAFGVNHLGWQAQLTSPLLANFRLVTFDHRGHGESGKPTDGSFYDSQDIWADDFEAVFNYVGKKSVIVAWSMSGSYLGDYLKKYGSNRIAAINLTAASNTLGTTLFTKQAGSAFLEAQGLFSDVLSEQMTATYTINKFMTSKPLPRELELAAFGWLMALPIFPRRVMFARDVDHRDVYRNAGVPILLSHGRDDQIVQPVAAEMLKEVVPEAKISWYENVGHAPHWESYEKYNRELAEFVKDAS